MEWSNNTMNTNTGLVILLVVVFLLVIILFVAFWTQDNNDNNSSGSDSNPPDVTTSDTSSGCDVNHTIQDCTYSSSSSKSSSELDCTLSDDTSSEVIVQKNILKNSPKIYANNLNNYPLESDTPIDSDFSSLNKEEKKRLKNANRKGKKH